jgi:hypothetical protein
VKKTLARKILPVKLIQCILVLAWIPPAHAVIRPSFWLSRCAWEATDVLELAIAPGEARFSVVDVIKGSTPQGAIKTFTELASPAGGHSLLKDLAFDPDPFSYKFAEPIAPPIQDSDRLIVFLRPGGKPASSTMLTSAIWLQDGVAYDFEQTMNPGSTRLVRYSSGTVEFENGKEAWKPPPEQDEALVRSDIRRLLQLRETFDRAVANPDAVARAAEIAGLVTSGDPEVIRGALAKLSGESPEAAHALRPFLDDDSLLDAHFQILDAIAATGARDIHLDSVIRRETAYWEQTCRQTLDANWVRSYGPPPASHYLRLVSAIKAVQALGINSDLPAIREFSEVMDHCPHLSQQTELVNLTGALLGR